MVILLLNKWKELVIPFIKPKVLQLQEAPNAPKVSVLIQSKVSFQSKIRIALLWHNCLHVIDPCCHQNYYLFNITKLMSIFQHTARQSTILAIRTKLGLQPMTHATSSPGLITFLKENYELEPRCLIRDRIMQEEKQQPTEKTNPFETTSLVVPPIQLEPIFMPPSSLLSPNIGPIPISIPFRKLPPWQPSNVMSTSHPFPSTKETHPPVPVPFPPVSEPLMKHLCYPIPKGLPPMTTLSSSRILLGKNSIRMMRQQPHPLSVFSSSYLSSEPIVPVSEIISSSLTQQINPPPMTSPDCGKEGSCDIPPSGSISSTLWKILSQDPKQM